MAERETGQEKANELLRSGRRVFLQTVGYTEAEILGLGDLAAVPSEKVQQLLERKTLDAAARRTLEKKVEIKILRQKKRKKSKRRKGR